MRLVFVTKEKRKIKKIRQGRNVRNTSFFTIIFVGIIVSHVNCHCRIFFRSIKAVLLLSETWFSHGGAC